MLYVVKLNDTNGVVQVIQPPRGICIRKLECEIPSRCGHFLTNIFYFGAFFLHCGLFSTKKSMCLYITFYKF